MTYTERAKAAEEAAKPRPKLTHPKGWEPGVAWNGAAGTLTTAPLEHEPGAALWVELIADWGLDPATTEVVPGSVQIRAWDANVGGGEIKRLRYYRAQIRARSDVIERADIDLLCKLAERKKAVAPKDYTIGTTLVVLFSDWQIGKGEGGGTPAATERITSAIDRIPERIKELRKMGRIIDVVVFACMGDMIEQCSGNYPSQAFTVDLDRREQMTLVRRLLLRAIEAVLKLVSKIVMCAVPGNHGENRNGSGKAYTRVTDNDDLAVVEQVGEVLAANPDRYGHVSVVVADGYNLVLDVGGVPVGFTHGYKAGGGANAQAKQESWLKGQALGRRPIADAQILFTGHYHHFSSSEATGRTWMQTPAMDGGSEWWTESTGQDSPPGMLTVCVGEAYGRRGWGDLSIICD